MDPNCRGHLCRGPRLSMKNFFAEGLSLPRAFLCRGPQKRALNKEWLCQVLKVWLSAKSQTFGRGCVSSNAGTLIRTSDPDHRNFRSNIYFCKFEFVSFWFCKKSYSPRSRPVRSFHLFCSGQGSFPFPLCSYTWVLDLARELVYRT